MYLNRRVFVMVTSSLDPHQTEPVSLLMPVCPDLSPAGSKVGDICKSRIMIVSDSVTLFVQAITH